MALVREPRRRPISGPSSNLAARAIVFAVLLISALAGRAPPALAHEITPAIATLDLREDGTFDLALSLNLEALMAEIGPEHADSADSPNAAAYDRLRALPPAQLAEAYSGFENRLRGGISLESDAGAAVPLEPTGVSVPAAGDLSTQRSSIAAFAGRVPFGAKHLRWRFDAAFGPSVIRARMAGGDIFHSDYVLNGEASGAIDVTAVSRRGAAALFADYVRIGFRHIVPEGLDHILFVVGLFLLSPRLKPLLWQVTCFTVAHSVTLALGGLGVLRLPPSLVEPLIALSIVYVAAENLWTDRLSRWRPFVIFLFGLVHGLGFAGVLSDVGLMGGEFLVGLVAFNVGVELGQLAVIGGCALAIGLWFGHERWYRGFIAVPASLGIAAIGAFWFLERII